MLKGLCASVLLVAAIACGGSRTATAPTPASIPASPTPQTTIVLTGQVTDGETSAPISGATVSIDDKYTTTTDGLGHYSVTGSLDWGGDGDYTHVSANNYDTDYRYIQVRTQNVHLYRSKRITAGESLVVTISPDDTLCVNNVQDEPDLGPDTGSWDVCRSVMIMATTDGFMRLEAVSTQGGSHPPLEIEVDGNPVSLSLVANPASFSVTAGKEVVVQIEMTSRSTASQTFTLTTSIAQR